MATVYFLHVATNQEKCQKIPSLILEVLDKGQTVALYSQEESVVDYLDDFLWRYPQGELLPHLKTSQPCLDPVMITQEHSLIDDRDVVMNLSPLILHEIKGIVIELYDQSHREKKIKSQKKMKDYRDLGSNVIEVVEPPFFM